MSNQNRNSLVLAVYVNSRGLAFVLFEGTLSPYDWGMFEYRGARRDASCLRKMIELLDLYDIDVLIIQRTGADGTRRAVRLSTLNTALEDRARERNIPVFKYSRADVYLTFVSASFSNEQSLARVIAKHIPAFERHVPPPRKPWMSEDARMGLFDAAALALVFFQRANKLDLPFPGA